jgi:exopolyphosphatase/guanosine-5'-triphosphate,3'-diphosphate pyrophosphatase
MKKIGVIDIGTNSMRMLISQIEGNRIINSYKTMQITRLGQGINEGEILPSALERNLKALKLFKEQAEEEQAEEILVFGTSALRDAWNSKDFIQRVKNELGITIEILSGKQEAEIGFMGAIYELSQDALIIDIGGGSTEFIIGDKDYGILDMISIDIGALRITEAYIKNDPIKIEEVSAIKEAVQDMVRKISPKFSPQGSQDIIGIGGTITTLSAIKQDMEVYNSERIHHSKLSKQDVRDILNRLRSLNLDERKKVKGLQPGRADIIIAGTIILKSIMEILEIDNIIVSDSDNLEGMLYYHMEKKSR